MKGCVSQRVAWIAHHKLDRILLTLQLSGKTFVHLLIGIGLGLTVCAQHRLQTNQSQDPGGNLRCSNHPSYPNGEIQD
jgi:hypothetical protein